TKKPKGSRKAEKPPPSCASLADAYARDVVDGTVVANLRVREACRRYLDLRVKPVGIWWDEAGAEAVRAFARKCGQGVEEGAGTALEWQPWQCLLGMVVHGARRLVEGVRTDFPYWKAVLVVMAKGNGKTETAAGHLMYGLSDPEKRLSFSCAAPDGRLSQIVWQRMRQMTETLNASDPDGVEWKATGATTIAIPGRVTHGNAVFTTLPCTDKALDGRMDRLCLMDEAARMRHGVGRLLTGLSKNPKAQCIAISTPDPEQRTMPIWAYWDACERALLQGEQLPHGWFALLYGLDQDDAADDPNAWPKAHPSLGVTTQRADIETAARTMLASGDPVQIAEFETQIACRYHEIATTDLDLGTLDRQSEVVNWDRLAGAPAVVAIDLSRGGYGAQLDLTSLCLMVVDGTLVRARTISWWAGTDIQLDERRSKCPLGAWVEQGHLRRMPGEWHDMAVVEAELESLMKRYDVRKIGVDPHPAQARDIRRWQERGWPIIPVDQSIRTMAPAWKVWCDLLRSKQLFYEPDPVLRSALNAVRLIRDNVGNTRPVKGRSAGNTDAVVAGNMAALLLEHHQVREASGISASSCPIG
ncbi:MAG: hypothetical protein RJB26_1448, partial [Pseudomonadota bacterium]